MCTTHGRNYVAHLTSEIFFSPFSSLSLSLPFFHKLLQDRGKLIDSLCKWVFSDIHGHDGLLVLLEIIIVISM